MERPRDALPEGTKLAGYVIGRVLGRGGFGVTYFGHDALFPDTKVAIKEFLPSGLAVREAGSLTVHPSNPGYVEDFRKALSRFEEEARTLVALRHPNVVEVQRYIEANGTAYVVMKYEEGRSLSELLSGGKSLSAAELAEIVPPLLDGLEAVHQRNYLHRDIKPGNIYIRAADGSPVLLDFGAARQAMGAERKTSLTEIVTPGYAPFEQYFRKGEQGPWTDIYALGATFYRCIAGAPPPEAPERMRRDTMVPAPEAGRGRYPDALLAAIDTMLMFDEKKRPQSIAEVRALLGDERVVDARSVSSPYTIVPPLPKPPPTPKPHDYRWPAPERMPSPKPLPRAEFEPRAQPAPPRDPGAAKRWVATLLVTGALLAGGYYLAQPGKTPPASTSSDRPPAPATTSTAPACRDANGWRAGCVFRDCETCPEMVVIPGGLFTMGSPATESERHHNESPAHQVMILRAFAMARHETTFDAFDACVAERGCSRRPDEGRNHERPGDGTFGRGLQPVVNVTWSEAREFAGWLARKTGRAYRLPSEAEWEYAARAGTTTPFSTGNTITLRQANYHGVYADPDGKWRASAGRSAERPVPVGSFPPNPFGLYDMHGNVNEFVEDCWNARYSGAPADGGPWLEGDCEQRVMRGGSWSSYPWAVRSAARFSGGRYGSPMDGFRLARALD